MTSADDHARRADQPGQSAADVLDVHILDIAAQLEALLRAVREIQRNVLRLRGALAASGPDADPVTEIQERLASMLRDCDAMRDVLESAAETGARLKKMPTAY